MRPFLEGGVRGALRWDATRIAAKPWLRRVGVSVGGIADAAEGNDATDTTGTVGD